MRFRVFARRLLYSTPNSLTLAMRLLLFLTLSIISLTSHAQIPDVPAAFNAISTTPETIHLKKNHIIIPPGGHLQGIQALSDSEFVITASSDSFAYYLTANRNELIAVKKLSIKPFRHAGGFQICDSIMVIGIENNIAKNRSYVLGFLFDSSAHIIDFHLVVTREGIFKRSTAGAVGLTRTSIGRYLLAVGDWDSRNIDFYLSQPDDYRTFDSLTTFHAPDDHHWPSYQSINLLTDTAGRIYLIGFGLVGTKNRADLYEVTLHPDRADLKLISTRNFKCHGTSFRYGSGIYVSEARQLHIYSCARNVTAHTAINIFR